MQKSIFQRGLGALAFVAAAFAAQEERNTARTAALRGDSPAKGLHDPQSGRYAYRGRPGTKAFQRAAQKRRNVIRHRASA